MPNEEKINQLLVAMSYQALAKKETQETVRTVILCTCFLLSLGGVLLYHHFAFDKLLSEGIESTTERIEIINEVETKDNAHESGNVKVIGVER